MSDDVVSGIAGASPLDMRPTAAPRRSVAEGALRIMGLKDPALAESKSGSKPKKTRSTASDSVPSVPEPHMAGVTDLRSGTPLDHFRESNEPDAAPMVQENIYQAPNSSSRRGTAEAALAIMYGEDAIGFERGVNADLAYDQAVDKKKKKRRSDGANDDMFDMDNQDALSRTKNPPGLNSEDYQMKKIMQECIGDLRTFRAYAGLQEHVAMSGVVPTPGAEKENKQKSGGLPGLEGTAMQEIDPVEGPGDKDEVGSDQYMTLDQSIAMLKKEGIDTEDLWDQFLENRGLTAELFKTLVDEAMDSEDTEEMDAILAVEELFRKALPGLLPEGLGDLFNKKPRVDTMAPVIKAAQGLKMKSPDRVDMSGRLNAMKQKPMKPTSVGVAQSDMDSASSVARKKLGDSIGENKAHVHCDHDKATGGPKMPWMKGKKSKMESLQVKYSVSEAKWMQKMHLKKGALHKELHVPMGKKIPAKKLQAAEKKPGLEGKRARLAMVFKKARK